MMETGEEKRLVFRPWSLCTPKNDRTATPNCPADLQLIVPRRDLEMRTGAFSGNGSSTTTTGLPRVLLQTARVSEIVFFQHVVDCRV